MSKCKRKLAEMLTASLRSAKRQKNEQIQRQTGRNADNLASLGKKT
jgi:hypothetical protein